MLFTLYVHGRISGGSPSITSQLYCMCMVVVVGNSLPSHAYLTYVHGSINGEFPSITYLFDYTYVHGSIRGNSLSSHLFNSMYVQWSLITANPRGHRKVFVISEIHYYQLKYHSRTLTGSHETIHYIQKFTVRDFFITSFHCTLVHR